jgi:dGTPase
VFVYHEGDHYRSRLTHSLEVAQIARTLARVLRLNEDLAEAIALAHDLGHTPFGHAGEDALSEVMAFCGGFDHNAQSLHIVTKLEGRYAAFQGLNLAWETLEGLVKHNGPLLGSDGESLAGKGNVKGLPHVITAYNTEQDLELDTYPSLEAQIASLADDIAYNNHDLDDGLRAEMIPPEKLLEVELVGPIIAEVERLYGKLPVGKLIHEVNRRLITKMFFDLVDETSSRIADLAPNSSHDIRHAGRPVAAFSSDMQRQMKELRALLMEEFYLHPRITGIMEGAKTIVCDLFHHFMEHPEALPEDWRVGDSEIERGRVIGDFVAGMTDRLAQEMHDRLFDGTPILR